ncbi:hypothetical protein G6011_09247 [Alternaria panax]|uniref:Uncharacterized protein n=1 Tax=Alternaria panax TaxID=48097 RepID=A0AAD4IAX6_9PLEO|nr:hypothetical protein G6011_09247 [Alternaria panax]
MSIRPQSVGSGDHSDAEAIELDSTTRRSDEFSLILKDDHADSPPTQQMTVPWLNAWVFETTSFGVASAMFTAVVIILMAFRGRQNPSWNFGITLNTVISVASMVFRIGLMVPVASCISQLNWYWFSKDRRPLRDVVRFDQASRSPYGSLQLLISHGVRSFAFLGAIVSLFSLLIGPFFQQSLVFYGDLVLDPSVDAYASYASTFSPLVGAPGYDGAYMAPNLRFAVYSEFLFSGVISPPGLRYSCPSGHCAWDPFHTLAVGVQCQDAPRLFNLKCDDELSYGSENCAILAIDEPDRFTRFRNNGKIGEGNTGEQDAFPGNVFYFTEAMVLENEENSLALDQSWHIPKDNRVDIDWIRATGLTNSFVMQNSTIESRQCKIFTCLQEISASVRNGTYKETIENVTTQKTEYKTKNGKVAYAYNFPNGTLSNITLEKAQQQALLDTISAPFGELRVFYDDAFGWVSSGKVTSAGGEPGTDILMNIYRTQNLTEMVHGLVHHMNVALRSVYTFEELRRDNLLPKDHISKKEQVVGNASIEKIHVRVRWEWLILPGVLMILTFALLVATIVQTRGQKIGVWKENPLALLLYSKFDDQCKSAMDCARTEKDIWLAAGGLDAQLVVGTKAGSQHVKDMILIRRKVDV